MARGRSLIGSFQRLRRDASGAALVEFAIVLPLMLIIFGVIIEGGRTFWSYQAAISGVRDAARYVGRVAPGNICTELNPGQALQDVVASFDPTLVDIIRENIGGDALFPPSITIDSATATPDCRLGDFRIGPAAPVATVTANLTITYPFAGLFTLVGGALGTVATTVSDESRIYGE